MRDRERILFTLLLLFSVAAYAGPGTYYNSIDTNQSCATLKTLLFNLTASNTTVIPYASVDNYYNLTDLKPAESGGGDVIVDRYCSENPTGLDYCNFRYPGSFCLGATPTTTCVCYDKEHVFPKSWFGGTDVYPMYSDVHFVWPSDHVTNGKKLNYPIGYVQSASFTSSNGTKVGTSNSSLNYGFTTSNVFEPIDSFKGDFARAYLYVVTRYQDSIPYWVGRSTSGYVLDGNKYPGLKSWMLQLCVKWSKMDPPSAFERQRNDAVYTLQGNRNPYIDYPHWVEKVFGPNGIPSSCVPLSIHSNHQLDFSLFPNPSSSVLNIKLPKPLLEAATLEVLDLLGRKVIEYNIDQQTTLFSIDTRNYSRGMYWVNIVYRGENNLNPFTVE
jgi:endonuclease I